jgi:4-diphosphocytidyl-2-C-methyl-D-erythritol kinase
MISFPNCKINLGLSIGGKRDDGYHQIDTFFYPLRVNDVLEIVAGAEFNFSISGLPLHGNLQDNLCIKAYSLLKTDFPQLPPVSIFLHKNIPAGSGLGGGSADASFTLMLLNELFLLNLTEKNLLSYALLLGSDCPFFIINKPCTANGRGENLLPVEIDLGAYSFVLVYPGIHIATQWAFSQLKVSNKISSIKEIVARPVSSWKGELHNDFEEPVFDQWPELKDIKETFYQSGALYASMSGSGSAIFGIFEKNHIPSFSFDKKYKVFTIE